MLKATLPLARKHIAIVGSGPSGFYTATALLKQSRKKKEDIYVTLVDKYPTPFGLSRYGVAPDHPEVKNCEETFTEMMNDFAANIEFVGNVSVGTDVKIKDLRRNFDVVVLAYGNTVENRLGIEGEDHPMVIDSKKFVAWYNGEPDILDRFTPPDLSKVKQVTVIGNGNVAMDVARMLLMPPAHLESSDIAVFALEDLKKSSVKELDIIARRGILESKFTTKEIRELFQLEEFGVCCRGIFPIELVTALQPFLKKMERVIKRKFETVIKFLEPVENRKVKYTVPAEIKKQWSLQYLRSPSKITINPGDRTRLDSITFQKNTLYQGAHESEATITPTSEFETQKTDLIITSVGFKGEPCEFDNDIKFDSRRGIIVNENFRVIGTNDTVIPGLYTTGWISSDSKGPILNTYATSTEVSEIVLKDLEGIDTDLPGIDGLELRESTSWFDWEKINEFELALGKLHGKVRWKIPTSELMMKIIKSDEAVEKKIEKFGAAVTKYGREAIMIK